MVLGGYCAPQYRNDPLRLFSASLLVFFFFRDFIFKKTLFEKLQYLKQERFLIIKKKKFA